MDRTSRIGLFACLLLLIASNFIIDKMYPPRPKKPAPAAATAASNPATPAAPGQPLPVAQLTSGTAPGPAGTAPQPLPTATFSELENDTLRITFTSVGAAITQIELKNQRGDGGGRVILNEHSQSNILALKGWSPSEINFASQLIYDRTQPTLQPIVNGITFTAALPNGMQWQRSYVFGKPQEHDSGLTGALRVMFHHIALALGHKDPKPEIYTLDVTDTVTNPGASDVTLPAYTLDMGRASPLRVNGLYQRIYNTYLGTGWLASRFHQTNVTDFEPGYILMFKTHDGRDRISSQAIGTPNTPDYVPAIDAAPLRWIGTDNQFFTVLLTPAAEKSIQSADFRCLNARDADGRIIERLDPEGYILPGYEPDLESSANFAALTVPAGKTTSIVYSLYAGPKDFNRLDALGDGQGALMNYDGILPFSLLIVPMLTVLHFWYLIFNNYGVAIILLTLMIKAITWPLQSIANRSGKRMQALAPKLKELQAKYKDTPEKLQSETFAMYKRYGVNPFGGCLPAFIQMPVFFSLYFMLQNAVELRGQSFLWVHDLTQPDTVASWALPFVIPFFNTSHIAIHPLPIMVTALTMVMMRLTPQIGDPTQAKIAQFMPLIFLVIFYNFAAGLSLYYVINNCVSIIQIYRNLKKPMPDLEDRGDGGNGGAAGKPRKKKPA